MNINFVKIFKSKGLLICVCVILSIVPFFWLKPGEMDLGGDSTRLYFYDPLNFLTNVGLYNVLAEGIGRIQPGHFWTPFVALLAVIKTIVGSSYLLITIFNSFKLVSSFIFVYLIVKEILIHIRRNKVREEVLEISSVIAGIFYVFIPTMIINWDKALVTHNQVFLNPMIFYLLMKYVLTKSYKFLWFMLLVTVLFAPNFSWIAAPPLFTFSPLAFLFLFLYTKLIRKVKIPWGGLLIGFIIFFGLHAFHIIPQIVNLLDPGSYIVTRVFDQESILNEGVRYFRAILSLSSVASRILTSPDFGLYPFLSVTAPLVVILGFVLNKKDKLLPLVGIFFLISLFFLTAKITTIGTIFYEHLFYIPGFSIFRNFLGQWLFVYSFFYSILLGLSLFTILPRFKRTFGLFVFLILILSAVLQASNFINGNLINHKHLRSDKYIAIKMDPDYEKFLKFIKDLPSDSKIITLPFSDFYIQVIADKNNGAYLGSSTISLLAGKKNFTGYTNMDSFAEVFFKLSKNKDYEDLEKLFGLLNIKYAFHNTDINVYDKAFPNYPYEYSRKFMPADQKGYADFVNELTSKKIYETGSYKLFEVKNESYLPHIYITKNLITYKNNVDDWDGKNMSFFVGKKLDDPRVVYVEEKYCNKVSKICEGESLDGVKSVPQIVFIRINPTKYTVKVSNVKSPYLLVFSEAFNSSWKVFLSNKEFSGGSTIASYFNGDIKEGKHKNSLFNNSIFKTLGKESLAENNHILVNGYANAWYISPQDMNGKKDYEITIEMVQQRAFYFGLAFSFIFFVGFLIWGVKLFIIDRFSGRIAKA